MSRGMWAGRLAGGAIILLGLLYLLAGECFQLWARLHLDEWDQQRYAATGHPINEWERVQRSVDLALRYWPWKQSLHVDAVRVQFAGEWLGHLMAQEAGAAALVYLDRSGGLQTSGEMLSLRARAHLRRGDPEAMAATLADLRRHAPYERLYWYPLLLETAEQAMNQPGFEPVARDLLAHYASFDLQGLRPLMRYSPAMRAMLPAEWRKKVLPRRTWWGPERPYGGTRKSSRRAEAGR